MGKSIDQQLTALGQKDYWTKSQFAAGELRVVHTKYDLNSSVAAMNSGGLLVFDVGGVITVLSDDTRSGWVKCMTKRGVIDLRRTFVVQYTNVHSDDVG